MEIQFAAATDVGRKRSHNEDNFLIDHELQLFVVADGMGGHATGDVASAMAVHTIRDIVWAERDILSQVVDHDPRSHLEVCTLLEYAIHLACETIYTKGQQEPEKRGMGTTVVALLLIGSRGYIAYVGDSRLYLLRGGIVYQLTEDHSLMNELVRQGKVSAEDFDDSPYAAFKHAMTRAVGPHEHVEVDTLDFDMYPGDAFLLCSDGLYEYLGDQEIAVNLSDKAIQEIPGRLIDIANRGGGKDNITAIVIHTPAGDGKDQAAEVSLTLDTLRRLDLFAQLSYQQLVRIMNVARQLALPAGHEICREGDPASELYIVVSGAVELTVGEHHFARLGPGEHFGEMALVDAAPRPATARAVEPARLLALDRAAFMEIAFKEPALGVRLMVSVLGVLGARLRTATELMRELKANGPGDSAVAASPTTGPFEALNDEDVVDLDDDAEELDSGAAIIEISPD